MTEHGPAWEDHAHEALVHGHEHQHVTHNLNERTGGFDHLSSSHTHDHDHAAVTHAHFPHRDFAHEHGYEAHDHDHGEPVKHRSPKTSSRKSPGDAAKPKTSRSKTTRAKRPADGADAQPS